MKLLQMEQCHHQYNEHSAKKTSQSCVHNYILLYLAMPQCQHAHVKINSA